MIKSLLSFLQECYSEKRDNRSFAALIRAIKIVGGVPLLQNIVMALIPSGKAIIDPPNEEIAKEGIKEEISDYRIINLSVKSLRKLQAPLGEDKFVGVGLAQKKLQRQGEYDYEPVSCLLLGENGVGKTSLFCSLEMAARGISNIARNHGFETSEQQRKFLSHGDGAEDPVIRLLSKTGLFETTVRSGNTPPQSLHLPQSFLCSTYDISILERKRIDSEYIMREMGRSEFLTLMKELRSAREVVGWLEEYKMADELLSEAKIGKEEEQQLKDRRKSFEKQIKNRLAIKSMTQKMSRPSEEYFKKLGKEVDEILEMLESEIQRIFRMLLDVSQNIMPNILRDFLYDCNLDIRMVDNAPSISLIVKSDVDGKPIHIEPRRFFNTFRLKLFAIAIKISMSCCVKILDKVNFPFIIDDTFDASDFISKREIKNFIHNILINHDGIKDLDKFPLQLIIFTQDDIIAQKAYKGLSSFAQGDDLRPLFLKLYDCEDVKESDYVTEKLDGEETSYFKIVDKIIG